MNTHTTAWIEALIGHSGLSGTAWDLASRAIDAVLEDGTEHHTGWMASDAIECAAPYVGELSYDEEVEALAASPVVHALINLDSNVLYAVGKDSEAARAELGQVNVVAQEWVSHSVYPMSTNVSKDAGRYAEYRIPDVICDEGSADMIAALGVCQGYWTATDHERNAA